MNPLATLSTARCLLDQSFATICEQVDSGGLLFVFDLCLGSRNRSLRFYTPELLTPHPVRRLALDDVVGAIHPAKDRPLRGQEVADLLVCSRPHVHALVEKGELSGTVESRTLWVDAESLARMLRRRWVGNLAPEPLNTPARCVRQATRKNAARVNVRLRPASAKPHPTP